MINDIKGTIIKVKIEDAQFELPHKIRAKIESFWSQYTEGTSLWNGEVMCVGEYKRDENEMIITCKKTDYAHYLYDERIGLSQEFACNNLAAACLLETSDNYYIIGELGESHSFPHCMQISGGAVDRKDIQNGNIDVFNTITRECEEELNIRLQDKTQVESFKMKYISCPTEDVHSYILIAKGKLKMTKFQMQEYYEQYLQYLKENNLEIEFPKIHFIKKGKTTEELKQFENPKRNYLESLLEIDSREKEIEMSER